MLSLKDIQEAQKRICDAIYLTPCAKSDHYFKLAGVSALYFKLENLHRTGSFKERGALNKMLTLPEDERRKGVITASAGNHAQGVAYHAHRLGMNATIVMPERTPLIKITSTVNYGAKVVQAGSNFDEAYATALNIQRQEHQTFIHPFNDPLVMAGQGTIGLELLDQIPHVEMVICSVGGGGLISGVACALKESNPKIQVIGVQASALPSMKASLDAGKLVQVESHNTIADGIAVKRPGDTTFPVIQKYVDAMVTVDEEEIANAILLLLEREKCVVEGAGAVTFAALINGKVPQAVGKKAAIILSGGNIDVNLLSRIIERGLVKDGRLVRMMVNMPDRPGSLARFSATVAEAGANVHEIYHNRAFSKGPLSESQVEVTLETRGRHDAEELLKRLRQHGWEVREEEGH